MKIVAIIVNLFFPGVGTFFVGKIFQAIFQIILWLIGAAFIATGIGVIIGGPIYFVAWIWALISAATAESEPVKVIVVTRNE